MIKNTYWYNNSRIFFIKPIYFALHADFYTFDHLSFSCQLMLDFLLGTLQIKQKINTYMKCMLKKLLFIIIFLTDRK